MYTYMGTCSSPSPYAVAIESYSILNLLCYYKIELRLLNDEILHLYNHLHVPKIPLAEMSNKADAVLKEEKSRDT